MFPPDQFGGHSYLRGVHAHERYELNESLMLILYIIGIIASVLIIPRKIEAKNE
jgi:hypothetical protein